MGAETGFPRAPIEACGRLPSKPLFLGPDLSLLMDFEASYQETCQRLRVAA